MRHVIRLNLGIIAGVLAGAGCQSLPSASKKEPDQQQPLSIMGKGGQLIGPDAKGESKAPQELGPKAASQACLAAAGEMEKNGQTEEAIRLYEKARADSPTLAAAISRRLGILYDKAGDFAKATVEYEIALKATPNDADLLNDLGYSYYSRNDWANAEKYLRQAVKIQSGHKRAWLNLGMALAAQGRWQDGYDAFLLAGTVGEAHCNIAMCMTWQGLFDDAKGQYRRAIEVDPGMQMARVALTKLETMPPLGTAQQAGAKGPLDPSKIGSIQEHYERIRASEVAAKVRPKAVDAESPIELEIP